MSVFLSVTDPYYERYGNPPEEEPDIADWEPEGDPFEHPLLLTATSVAELQTVFDPPVPERKPAEAQLNLFREVA
jgi:hypothetical protein